MYEIILKIGLDDLICLWG